MNFMTLKISVPPDPRESFYLTTLQAESRVTNICFDGWGCDVTRGLLCGFRQLLHLDEASLIKSPARIPAYSWDRW